MKKTVLLSAAAALCAAGCSVDATKFTCSSSAECPSGYHCDIGTASAAGSFKCANGAAPQKTLTADASKFLLVKRPESDGTVRTTISAKVGAVTSTPDFVGVRVVASQGNADLADSPVAADGSVLGFQLPQPLTQVSLRVQDDSGRSVPVTGYNQQVELSFVGREVAGTTNTSAAFDVTTRNDGVFPPTTWIASGPGPGAGNRAQEFNVANTLDGGVVVASNSYTSIAYPDFATAATSSPPSPDFGSFSPPDAGSPLAWEPVVPLATTADAGSPPPARIGPAVAPFYGGFYMFGGAADATGTPADPQGSFYSWVYYQGWTFTPAPAGSLPSARSGAAMGRQGVSGSCYLGTAPCDYDNFPFVVAGGQGPTGVMTNEIQALDFKTSYTNFSLPPTESRSWRLVGLLPFANAGMQSASGYVPFNAVVGGVAQQQIYAGGMMIYGRAITTANSGTQGCLLFGAVPQNPAAGTPSALVPIQPNSASCVGSPSLFDATTGLIGFRQGATLVADPNSNPTIYYLFGGRKTTGATTTALQNDLWQAKITCVGAPCVTTTTWQQLSGSGGVPPNFPTPRAGAGGAMWNGGRLVIHGGVDANGALGDLWEWDPSPAPAGTWRQVPMDQTAGVLAPPARAGFTMTADLTQQQIFTIGGIVTGGAVTDQMWLTGHESAAKLLVKVPFSLPAIDQARNLKLTVDALGTQGEQVFIWDGTTWRYIASTDFNSYAGHITVSPTAPLTGFLQPDGNLYLLFMQAFRNQWNYGPGYQSPVSMDRLKITVDFQ